MQAKEKMNLNRIYRIVLNIGISLLMIDFLFHIMHWPGAYPLKILTFALTLSYVILGMYIIYKDNSKGGYETGAWLIGFLLLAPITGLYYYHTEIKRKKTPAPNK